jgi:hypothetical protein
LLVANSFDRVKFFHRRKPTSKRTDDVTEFAGWCNAKDTVALRKPEDVVEDFTDERKCYRFKAPYKDWKPQNFTHPLDFSTFWKP